MHGPEQFARAWHKGRRDSGMPHSNRVCKYHMKNHEGEDETPAGQKYELRLYVAGQTPKSIKAFANLHAICEEYLSGQYRIEVIDLTQTPQLAAGDQILAVPTLVRKLPEPITKIIGDLSNTERVLVGLNLWEVPSTQEW